MDRSACAERLGTAAIDQARALVQVVGIKQVAGRHLHVLGIGNMPMKICQGELDRLDLEVDGLPPIGIEFLDPEAAQNTERHQRGDPLAIRRDLVQGRGSERLSDRAAPVVVVRGKILDRQAGSVLRRKGRYALGEFTLVEGSSLRLGDQAERPRQRLIHKPFACPWGASARHESFREAGKILESHRASPPEFADHRGHEEPPFGVVNRGLKQLRERERAGPPREIYPSHNRAWDSDTFKPSLRHGAEAREPLR